MERAGVGCKVTMGIRGQVKGIGLERGGRLVWANPPFPYSDPINFCFSLFNLVAKNIIGRKNIEWTWRYLPLLPSFPQSYAYNCCKTLTYLIAYFLNYLLSYLHTYLLNYLLFTCLLNYLLTFILTYIHNNFLHNYLSTYLLNYFLT